MLKEVTQQFSELTGKVLFPLKCWQPKVEKKCHDSKETDPRAYYSSHGTALALGSETFQEFEYCQIVSHFVTFISFDSRIPSTF